MKTYHKHLQQRGFFKEHYSTGGHTIWMEGYARAGYFNEHQDKENAETFGADKWVSTYQKSRKSRAQTHFA